MHWVRRLFQKSRIEKHLDKELRFHLERQIADYMAAGLSAAIWKCCVTST